MGELQVDDDTEGMEDNNELVVSLEWLVDSDDI